MRNRNFMQKLLFGGEENVIDFEKKKSPLLRDRIKKKKKKNQRSRRKRGALHRKCETSGRTRKKKKSKSSRNRGRLLSWQLDRFLPVQWMPCYLGWIVRARVERFVANYS